MRRADARRSASVMISSSIRWSLAGNDVDWMMKTSEPRTFSWISTKISMSAKRRTLALVSGSSSAFGDFLRQHRIGIAGDQLDRAVLGRHRRFSPWPGGYNIEHIGTFEELARFDGRGDIKEEPERQPAERGFPAQNPDPEARFISLTGAVAQGADAECARRLETGPAPQPQGLARAASAGQPARPAAPFR